MGACEMMDVSLLELLPDTITIEPFSANSTTQAPTYGAAVSYRAQVTSEWGKTITERSGRTFQSTVRILIPDRVHVDPRDRLTLPTGFVPNQPPILSVSPTGGVLSMAMDSTEILC